KKRSRHFAEKLAESPADGHGAEDGHLRASDVQERRQDAGHDDVAGHPRHVGDRGSSPQKRRGEQGKLDGYAPRHDAEKSDGGVGEVGPYRPDPFASRHLGVGGVRPKTGKSKSEIHRRRKERQRGRLSTAIERSLRLVFGRGEQGRGGTARSKDGNGHPT